MKRNFHNYKLIWFYFTPPGKFIVKSLQVFIKDNVNFIRILLNLRKLVTLRGAQGGWALWSG